MARKPQPRVKQVSVVIRYSSPLRQGPWKTLELGAEAEVGPRQNWLEVQSELYAQLADHFRELWPNGLARHDDDDDYDYIGGP